MSEPLTRDQAMMEFKNLVAQYGLRWNYDVPIEAYDQLRRINEILTESDRREALGLPR